jgi:hypothetical protein
MRHWIGRTVGEVLALCNVHFSEVSMIDEPPGKLRAVAFTCRDPVGDSKVELAFDYDASLFSSTRSWPRAVVEQRQVSSVRTRQT